jgi:hypothetical protein
LPSNVDGSAHTDGATPSDGGKPSPDAGDASSPSDGSTTDATDGGTQGDAAPITGLSWPAGQAFPTFAPPAATLDVVNETGLSADTTTLIVTLQGLINRTQPRIWVTDGGSTQAFWLGQIDAGTNTVSDPLSLVTKYKSEIAGIIIYDDKVADTLNLATTMAGVKGGIVSSPALSTTLTAAPYSLPVLADLRTNAFTSTVDVYKYELDNYASLTTHRLITGLELTIPDHLRDYTVATQAMMVWLDPTDATQKALLDQFLALMEPNSPYLGWWTSEGPGVQTAATHGVPVFAADWSMNLTVLGGTPRALTPPPAPPPPPLENKMYVAIFMSDGDNLQEDEGLIPLKWADSKRGSVPISWTVDPALVDVAPVILRYYQRTATPNDLLVSGPSGLGYTYPAAWPASLIDSYTQISGKYMASAGLDVITLWNNGADLSAAVGQSYVKNVPNLLGMTIQQDSVARQFVSNVPVDLLEVTYAPTEQDLENGLNSAVAAYDGSKPSFAAIQGDMNYSTIMPANFLDVRNYYANNSNVVFVRADHYFQLMSRANAPPQHELFAGDVNGDGKTDAFFYYGGNGDEFFGISDGANLNWSKAGNVSGFGNLLDGSHSLFTGDFTGDKKTDFAFYYSGNGSVWLGTSTGTALSWAQISTASNGNWIDGKHRTHVADYNGDGAADFFVYNQNDGSTWLGISRTGSSGTTLTWSSAGSVGGFGNLLDGSHAFVDGDFDGDGKQDVLFYYNGDGSLWLGHSTGTALTWSNVGNVSSFGNIIDYNHKLVSGDFNGDGKTDLAFYYAGDGSVWLGISSGTAFTWASTSTPGMGNLIDWNHRLYTADVNGDGKSDVVSYDVATGDWQLGISSGTAITWSAGGNTSAHGDLADFGHVLLFGSFDGSGKKAPLFYGSGDGHFWMGTSSGTAFSWHDAGNASGFGNLAQ